MLLPIKLNQNNFKKANYEVICEELNRVNWEWILTSSGTCVQLLYDHILDILSCAIKKYVFLETLSESIKKPHHLSKALKEKLIFIVRVKMTLSTFLPIKPSPKSMTDVSENGMILKCQFVKILLMQNYVVT